MTYEAFKRELYQHVFMHAKACGKVAKLLEKGAVSEDGRLLQAIKIINVNEGRSMGNAACEDTIFVLSEALELTSIMHWKVRPLYESFKREGWQSVLPEIVMKLQKTQRTGAYSCAEDSFYGEDAERLIVRPLNFVHNRQELENCVYWRFGEIALVLYEVIYDTDTDFMTMKMTRGMLGQGKISDTETLTNALLNTYAKMPPRLYPGTTIQLRYDSREGSFMKEEEAEMQIDAGDMEAGLRGYRLTTVKHLNGAVAIFYPGVKERLAEIFEGDYYVGFTSIHEAVIHPARHKILGEMKAAIQHANAVFDQRDMLTNAVYRYCCDRKALVEA